jgi:hypothetical protein
MIHLSGGSSGGGLGGPVVVGPVGGTGAGIRSNVPVLTSGNGSNISSRLLGGILLSLGRGLNLLRITVEVKIGHDGPSGLTVGDYTSQTQNLSGKHPPNETNRVLRLVVAGNGNINVLRRRVGIRKGNNRDVDIRGLLDGLSVRSRVSDNDETRLLERAGDVVGEVTWGKSSGNSSSTSVVGELQDSTLAISTGRNGNNVGSLGDGSNDAGSKDQLLPGLANVNDVDTVGSGLVNVGLVVDLYVSGK